MFEFRLENEAGNIVNINDGESYLVIGCEGLNPPSASVFTSKSPNRKGLKYNGSSLDERNMLITIQLLGDVEESRNALYEWVSTENYIKIYYKNGKRDVYIEGYVQGCPIDFFVASEVVVVSVVCPDPYFKALQDIKTDITSLLSQFVFPFSIDADGIPFSTLREDNHTTIFNAGAETGCLIELVFEGVCSDITIYNAQNTNERMVISYSFYSGDIVRINTGTSPKRIELTTVDGVTSNILRYVENNPTWFNIKKGVNVLGYTALLGQSNMKMTVSFTNKYLGV